MDVWSLLAGLGSGTGEPISHDMKAFREILKRSTRVVVLSGAGTSAESGVPTFRGAGGYWRRWQAQELATPESFSRNPSLVWEFYNYRREVMRTKHPNKAHEAIAQLEEDFEKEGKGRKVTVITQNIDRLHHQAKSKNILELHGSLFHTRCTKCHHVEENIKSPLCPALEGKGAPDPEAPDAQIPVEDLPRCEQPNCGGLLRPHVVWFNEALFPDVLEEVDRVLDECDLCLVVGTSSVVYPAAAFAPRLARRGVPVAEFNIEVTPATGAFQFHFQGKAGDLLPVALAMEDPPSDVLEKISKAGIPGDGKSDD